MNQPSTAAVLEALANVGIVVGSAATAKHPEYCKDVDVVIPSGRHFFGPLYEWRTFLDSSITGHLVVRADPVLVEVFEDRIGVLIKDPIKRKVLAYTTLRNKCQWKELFGVRIRCYVHLQK